MPQYWVIATTKDNFAVDRQLGFRKQGFKDRWRNLVDTVRPGDRMIVYVTRSNGFGAAVEVTGKPYHDDSTRIWGEEDEIWPCRFDTKPLIVLEEDEKLNVRNVLPALTFITEKQKSVPTGWGLAFHQSLRQIPQEDYELIESEMRKLSSPASTVVASRTEPPVTTLPPSKPRQTVATGRIFGGVLNFRGLQHEL